MSRSVRWLLPVAALIVVGVSACGTHSPPAGAGKAASINMSLTTVPTIRSVTVSPGKAVFGRCSGGSAGLNTASTPSKLGYPNGQCWLGKPEPGGSFPITITNTGIASDVYVSGSNATPSDDGDEWDLCNAGLHPVVTCTGARRSEPGTNQYRILNFSPDNKTYRFGLSDDPACDRQFSESGGCFATEGQFQTEGIELIGPASSSDTSTGWTVTITWMPVPS
ncbi:MAG: hypothetical protein WAK71_16510 [Streptosporangiaceae bacterium]